MATKKISELTAKGATLGATDLFEISEGGTVTKSITGQQILDATNGNYSYTEVTITSAQILALGATPKTLLAAPGAGTYYDISRVILEYDYGTTPYVYAKPLYLAGAHFGIIRDNFITDLTLNKVVIVNAHVGEPIYDDSGTLYPLHDTLLVNQALTLTTWDGADPTTGDGTILAKIYYKIDTFG